MGVCLSMEGDSRNSKSLHSFAIKRLRHFYHHLQVAVVCKSLLGAFQLSFAITCKCLQSFATTIPGFFAISLVTQRHISFTPAILSSNIAPTELHNAQIKQMSCAILMFPFTRQFDVSLLHGPRDGRRGHIANCPPKSGEPETVRLAGRNSLVQASAALWLVRSRAGTPAGRSAGRSASWHFGRLNQPTAAADELVRVAICFLLWTPQDSGDCVPF